MPPIPIAAARSVAADNPTWETTFLPGVGHTPQLEVPDRVVARVASWLDDHDFSGRP